MTWQKYKLNLRVSLLLGIIFNHGAIWLHIICKFSNERTCKHNKDVQGLSCGFEDDAGVFLLPLFFRVTFVQLPFF